jgi:hypothetical protein
LINPELVKLEIIIFHSTVACKCSKRYNNNKKHKKIMRLATQFDLIYSIASRVNVCTLSGVILVKFTLIKGQLQFPLIIPPPSIDIVGVLLIYVVSLTLAKSDKTVIGSTALRV